MTTIHFTPSRVHALEQDVKRAVEIRRSRLSIFCPKQFTYVIKDPNTSLPDDFLDGEHFEVSTLQAPITDELEQDVKEILGCLRQAGRNIGKLEKIMCDGASYLIYRFNALGPTPALA
ncbi:MAG: hypothetical protein WAV04_01300 [Candidatus Microsaccharimonas sp.]